MSTTSWLDALKQTLEEQSQSASRSSREDLRNPIPSTLQNMQKPQEEAEPWDKDVASALIKEALADLCEQHKKVGNPDFDAVAINAAYDRVDEACRAEDMPELRRAVQAFIETGLEAFTNARQV